MFYIHETSCISSQQTYSAFNIEVLHEAVNNMLAVQEPIYDGIPSGILRRMGKAIRLGVGTALQVLGKSTGSLNGIIIGTGNGGMEDCIKFLNQIIDYKEGMLTPTNFVQSTTNAIAAQIGLLSSNKAYNITHVQRGLAFENALLDAGMALAENNTANYVVGGVDEISAYQYNIDNLAGWYKKEPLGAKNIYGSGTAGSIAGEGAAMFFVNNDITNASAAITGVGIFHSANEQQAAGYLESFLKKHLPAGEKIDLFLSGEDGDIRLQKYYEACEAVLNNQATVARFKHITGEYATVSAIALWLTVFILRHQMVPAHMLKHAATTSVWKRVLIYNNHKGRQHGFILVEKPSP